MGVGNTRLGCLLVLGVENKVKARALRAGRLMRLKRVGDVCAPVWGSK